jgi:uncharacterized protein DUF5329
MGGEVGVVARRRWGARAVGAVCLSLVCVGSGWHTAGTAWPAAARAADAPGPLTEQQRIAALLAVVDQSGATFIREGKEYSAAEGRRHLERKLWFAGSRVETAEDFIDKIASRSSITGRPYLVRLPSGKESETGVWLRQKLAEIDGRR